MIRISFKKQFTLWQELLHKNRFWIHFSQQIICGNKTNSEPLRNISFLTNNLIARILTTPYSPAYAPGRLCMPVSPVCFRGSCHAHFDKMRMLPAESALFHPSLPLFAAFHHFHILKKTNVPASFFHQFWNVRAFHEWLVLTSYLCFAGSIPPAIQISDLPQTDAIVYPDIPETVQSLPRNAPAPDS